ncbi:MAG: hypothetical protein ACFE8E_03885 [Candidatus Hodarchaeota archaeon]
MEYGRNEHQYAKQRMIKDITEEDVRIQVTGYFKERIDNDIIVLDDQTGDIMVNLKDVDFKFKKNDLINVIGDLNIKVNGEKELEADIIQDMNNLNFEYYKKIYEIKKELI